MSLLGRYTRLPDGELPADVAAWPADARDQLDERVAIMVVSGGLAPDEAAVAAEASVRQNRRNLAAAQTLPLQPPSSAQAAVATLASSDEALAGAGPRAGRPGGGMVPLRAVGATFEPESSP